LSALVVQASVQRAACKPFKIQVAEGKRDIYNDSFPNLEINEIDKK